MAKMTIGFREMVESADQAVETVAVNDAAEKHDAEDIVFVDIRDVRELEREGMIPGAFHCPRGMLEFWAHPESPYHKPIFAEDKTFVLYCASGWRSALSAKTLQDMGMTNVAHLGGGFSAWKEAGAPVGEKVRKPKS